MARPKARLAATSWLFLLVILADSSRESIPHLPNRLRCWAMADCALRDAWEMFGRRTRRGRPAGFASAAELTDEPQLETRYCPTESRTKPKQASAPQPGDGNICERVLMEVKNSSGVVMNVFRVNSEGQEVLSLIADPNEASMVTTCRGQLWRARSSFSGPPDRRRLLSEIDVPTPLSVAGAAGAEKMENMLGEKIPWEVLPCVGFPLPKSFDVSSSLGGLGHLQLSRKKEAPVHPSTDIEGLVSLTLEEVFRGKDVSVTVQRRVACPVCHGLGATTFVSCDRCGGSGKRLHDVHLTGADHAPSSDSCRSHRHGMGSATTENTDVHHGGVGNGNSDSSGHHVHRNCTGGGGYGGETTVGQGETDCNNQNALNRPTDETFRKEKAAADGAKTEGDANTGGLKLSHTADCSKCKGSGNIPAPRNEEGGGYCTRCAGARFVEEEEKLVLSIPAGVEKGQTEVYKDKGHVDLADIINTLHHTVESEHTTPDRETDEKASDPPESSPAPSPSPGPPVSTPSTSKKAFFAQLKEKKHFKTGSFRLTVDVLPHAVFSRGEEGADLYTSVAISLEEALTGFTRKITVLDGSVVALRRTSRTLPGMMLRFPGLGMPISVVSDGIGPSTFGEDIKPTSSLVKDTTTAAETDVVEAVSRTTVGAAADEDQGGGAPPGESKGFGDLFVEASITLPAGMRDDRSKFMGEFLKAGSEEAIEQEESEDMQEGGGEWRETRRRWRRGYRRRRAEAAATAAMEEVENNR